MITFKICFILAFPLKQKPDKKEKKKGKEVKQGKGKKGKKSETKSEKSVPPAKPKYVFEIDKVIGVAHIEYELVPKMKYLIDVVCCGPIAKVYTNDGQKILKTVVRQETAWVPVYMEHYLENLPTEDLKKFCEYIVEFKFFNNANKLGKMAKSSKSKIFYAYAEEAESEDLVEVFNEDPNLIAKTFEQKREEALDNMMKDIILQCANGPKNDFVSWLHYPDNYDYFYEVVKKKTAGVVIECKDFVLPCKPWEAFSVKNESKGKAKPGGKKDKPKKEKKAKSKKGKGEPKQDVVTISVPAEVFFTDPFMAKYKSENNRGGIKHVFLQFSVDRLITRAQKLALNPLVIRIKKLSNVPVNILNNIGISSVYTKYDIPYVASCTSIEKPIAKTIKFNEAHIHFNDANSRIKLIEFIQTRKLFMEIYGKRKPSPLQRQGVLFGNEIDDGSIAKIIPVNYQDVPSKKEAELLAVCGFDISSLIDNIWDFKEKGQCHGPELTVFHKTFACYDVFSYVDVETVNEININPEYSRTKGPIAEEILLSFGTTLQVEVYLLAPQAASLIFHYIPHSFRRLLVIFHSEEFSKNIHSDIRKHNENIYLEEMKKSERNIENTDTITGFMIDNGNNYIFFLEGLSTGFVLNVWHLIQQTPQLGGTKIFFNSEISFETRMYSHFLDVGVVSIILKIPLHDILSNQRLYWTGHVPLPCMEALKKLCLICHSWSYKSVLQSNLLPKPMELLSLNVEWGVPLRLKEVPKEIEPLSTNNTSKEN